MRQEVHLIKKGSSFGSVHWALQIEYKMSFPCVILFSFYEFLSPSRMAFQNFNAIFMARSQTRKQRETKKEK